MQQSMLGPKGPTPPSNLSQKQLGPLHMLTAGSTRHSRLCLLLLQMQVQAVTAIVRCQINSSGHHSLLAALCPLPPVGRCQLSPSSTLQRRASQTAMPSTQQVPGKAAQSQLRPLFQFSSHHPQAKLRLQAQSTLTGRRMMQTVIAAQKKALSHQQLHKRQAQGQRMQ